MHRVIFSLLGRAAFLIVALPGLALGMGSMPDTTPFRVVVPTPMTSMDPVQTVDAATLQVHLNTYALLYRQRASGALEPSLATGASSSQDRRHWKIELRKGVHFCGTAEGREVNAEDVAATLLRAASHPRSRVSWLFRGLKKEGGKPAIQVTGPYSLSIDFDRPIDLPRYLALPQLGILPHEAAGQDKLDFKGHSLGSGPYEITRVLPDRIELEACPLGWPRASVNNVSLRVIRDPEVALGVLSAGRADAMDLSFSQWRRMQEPDAVPKGFRLVEQARVADFEFILLNTHNPKLRDPRIRQALNYSLDRARLCAGPLLGYCVPGDFTSVITDAKPANDLYRPDLAQAAWKAAPVRPDSLTLLSLPDERNVTTASWAAEQWRKAFGLETKIRTIEFGPLLGTLFSGKNYDMATLWVQPLADIPEIWYLAWQPGDLPPKGRNVARLDDPDFTAAFRDFQALGSRPEILKRVEESLRANPPAIPLGRRRDAWLISERYQWEKGPILVMELWTVSRQEKP